MQRAKSSLELARVQQISNRPEDRVLGESTNHDHLGSPEVKTLCALTGGLILVQKGFDVSRREECRGEPLAARQRDVHINVVISWI